MNNLELVADLKLVTDEQTEEAPLLLEEIHLEKITIDGICGVY